VDITLKVDLTEVISLTLATAHPHFGENDSIYISGSSFKGRPNHHIVRIPPYSAVAGRLYANTTLNLRTICPTKLLLKIFQNY